MNKKLKRVLLGLLVVSLIITTASATNLDDHIAGIGMMAHPTSNTGVTSCQGCHNGNTAPTCISCHGVYPTFTLSVVPNPTTVTAGKSTSVSFTVTQTNNVKVTDTPAASGAVVTLSGPGVSTSGTTSTSGIVAIPVNPTGAGTINAIAAMTGFNSGTAAVTVTAPAPVPVLTTIAVTPATATVVQGNTQAFTASPKDQFGNPITATIVWSSSNTSVGTISASGVLTAVSAGTTTVTASSGSVKGTAAVTVTAPAPVPVLTTIAVTPATATVVQGNTQAFTASPKDQSGNPIAATIVWSSSNTSVGTISASGVLTAVSAGTTTVTATSGSVKGTAAVTVTQPSTGNATVNFVVTDSKTRRTIHEAKVSFGGKTKETDDHGMVKFTDVVPGTYTYKVTKERYQTITNSINVTGNIITVYVKMLKTTSRYSESHD